MRCGTLYHQSLYETHVAFKYALQNLISDYIKRSNEGH